MFRILHLSDIHIGKTYKEPEDIACKIISDISYNRLAEIDCVVVTGDIFDGQVEYTDALKNKAVAFFETLIKEINYNQENKKITKDDVIFVPGNHDLIRDNNEEVRWKKYSDFLQTLYGGIPDFYNSTNFSLYKEYKEQKIAFVGFNVSA